MQFGHTALLENIGVRRWSGLFKCPNCKGKDLGKIGVNQYYCWSCFIELSVSKGIIYTHQVEEDGSLSSLDDLFEDEDRTISM
jgi:hypothetical protein